MIARRDRVQRDRGPKPLEPRRDILFDAVLASAWVRFQDKWEKGQETEAELFRLLVHMLSY